MLANNTTIIINLEAQDSEKLMQIKVLFSLGILLSMTLTPSGGAQPMEEVVDSGVVRAEIVV